MPITRLITYTAPIENFEDLSDASIIDLLKNVRNDLKLLFGARAPTNLQNILEIVDRGSYKDGSDLVNLQDAKKWIDAYREESEGGCKSCVHFGTYVPNNDRDTWMYCTQKEDQVNTPLNCGYECGPSPEVYKHFEKPCEIWRPKFSPPLEILASLAAKE